MRKRLGQLLGMCMCALALSACGSPGEGPGGPGGAPPAESYTACDGKTAGDACTMKAGARSMDGMCAAAKDDAADKRLSCRPKDGPKAP
jgi:spore coat protein H